MQCHISRIAANDFLPYSTKYWLHVDISCNKWWLEGFSFIKLKNRTGGVVAIAAVCSLCLSCFSISLLRDSPCRRMPTSSVICSFISLISTSFSLTWHLIRTIDNYRLLFPGNTYDMTCFKRIIYVKKGRLRQACYFCIFNLPKSTTLSP